LCIHDREPVAAAVPAGPHGAHSVGVPSGGSSPEPTAPDDCFCCSRFVHPQVRYEFVPVYAFIATVENASISRPQFSPSRLYHPPLA
jgi:hypothetical protein